MQRKRANMGLRLTVTALALMLLLLAGCSGGPLRAQEPTISGHQMWMEFTRSNGETAAQFFVSPRRSQDGFTEIVVQFAHIPDVGYRLDSFTVEIVAERAMHPLITLEPEYQWEAMQFDRIDSGVRMHVPDTGHVGDGTITLSFWLPDRLMAEHDVAVRASLETKHGAASGELRLHEQN